MKKKQKKETSCMKIQWGKDHFINGKAVCPSCGKDAEKIIGVWGQACWGHKI